MKAHKGKTFGKENRISGLGRDLTVQLVLASFLAMGPFLERQIHLKNRQKNQSSDEIPSLSRICVHSTAAYRAIAVQFCASS